jgi:hypothetical protein
MGALEQLLNHPGLWRGAGTPENVSVRPSGFAPLDEALRGGWPRGRLIELIGGPFGCGETRILLPMLADCATENLRVVLVGPPAAPWIPGWKQLGVPPEQILLIRTERVDDAVWSCEQVLRHPGIGAVLAWLQQPGIASLRRLRLAAVAGEACAFLYRPSTAATQPSPAHLRIRWQGAQDHLRLEIFKNTGGWPARTAPIHVPIESGIRHAPQR